MRVYLDTCVIQRPFDDQTQVRIRVETEAVMTVVALCRAGTFQLVASDAHTVETRRCPLPERRAHAEDVLSIALNQPTVPQILHRAGLYQAAGIRVLDALHPAAAVEARADVFCTTDDALLRRGQSVDTRQTSVLSPLTLILRLSEV